jgi:hypothetical protein
VVGDGRNRSWIFPDPVAPSELMDRISWMVAPPLQ